MPGGDAVTPAVEVSAADTGDAATDSGGTAVTGYRGSVGSAPGVPVRVIGTGDASASGGGLANTGYIGELRVRELTMVRPRGPQQPAAWPHQVGVIPLRAQSFQRRAESERLRAAMEDGGTAVSCQVLTGMGGVGKTQLAAEYARSAWEGGRLDVLVWITASTRSAVMSGYAQAGVELCRGDPANPEQAAQSFLAWLQPKSTSETCRWLVVLDDISDLADLRGLWPPANEHGRTVATTRRREAAMTGQGRRLVEVGLFSDREADTYLTASLAAYDRHEPADQLTGLAGDLGYLPLALSQATAYLVDTGLSCAAYRALFADRVRKLADLLPEPEALPDDQSLTVAAAWSLSIDRADHLSPAGLASPMLGLTAMLDPNSIPAGVLVSDPALAHLAEHRNHAAASGSQPTAISAEDAVRALRALHRLSLIEHSPNSPNHAVRVHQLIQRTVRDTFTSDDHDRLARTAADALTAAWPTVERDTDLGQVLRANADVLRGHAENALWQPEAHDLLRRAGESLLDARQLDEARDYFRHLADVAQRLLTAGRPISLSARAKLAFLRGAGGHYADAVALYSELLADQLEVLDPDHREVMETRRELAEWRARAWDHAGAVTAYTELLTSQQRVLGEDHPETLNTRRALATELDFVGDYPAAVTALTELRADQARLLGTNHPDTLGTQRELARITQDKNGSATAQRELLEHTLRTLGADNPETLNARHELARTRRQAGDHPGAVAAFAELLTDQVRVLGQDHPDTMKTRWELALLQKYAGDLAGAVVAFAALFADQLRALGPDHSDTAVTRLDIIAARAGQWYVSYAPVELLDLLVGQIMELGPVHPDTLTTLDELASWRAEQGDVAGAVATGEELLIDRVRVLGLDHPDTLSTWEKLAHWRQAATESP